MKNLLGLCAAILFCGSAFGFESVPRLHEDWWKQKFERNRKMIAESGGTFDIVMLGDSITHYWEVGEGRDESRDIEILERKYKMLNCGYGGDHIENLLWRVRNGELDGYKARLVTLMIGTNNYADPVERIAEGVRVGGIEVGADGTFAVEADAGEVLASNVTVAAGGTLVVGEAGLAVGGTEQRIDDADGIIAGDADDA